MLPSTMQRPVKIPAHCKQAMLEHALRELPNECCGVLIGRGNRIERSVAMRSTDPSPDAYFMDPEEQAALFTGMATAGEQLLGIYHSHPRGPASPSAADLRLAFHPDVIHIVISLVDPEHPDVRGYALLPQGFAEAAVEFF